MSDSGVRAFFDALPSRFHAAAAEGVTAVYQFDLSGNEGGQYQLHIADQTCRVSPGIHPSPNVTLRMAGEDCVAILEGRLNGVSAYLNGRLQVDGDIGLAMQLPAFFPDLSPR
jgi:putative sterol carrier protein